MSSATRIQPVSRAPQRAAGPAAAPPLPALTKRRVIDLMRVGRSSCRRRRP